jgi:hypothetical protein
LANEKETSKPKVFQKANRKTESTPEEKKAVEKVAKDPSVRPIAEKADKDGRVQTDHEDSKRADAQMRKAFGSSDRDFVHGLFRQLNASEGSLDFSASVVRGVEPHDQLEAMLAAQMAAIHRIMFDLNLRLAQSKAGAYDNDILSAINKLARTYTIQLDALKRYRSKGEQQVTVQHVTVGQGGQAIVGDVHQRQREGARASATPPALTHSSEQPMQPLVEVPKEVVMAKRDTRK